MLLILNIFKIIFIGKIIKKYTIPKIIGEVIFPINNPKLIHKFRGKSNFCGLKIVILKKITEKVMSVYRRVFISLIVSRKVNRKNINENK